MRQRILVIAALLLACYLAGALVFRFGKGSDVLALQNIKGINNTYIYLKIARSDRMRDPVSSAVRETSCQFVFKDRQAKGSRPFSSSISISDYAVSVDGKPISDPPRLPYSNMQLDARGRILVNERTDLYPLDMLNAPEFFPILSGTDSVPGEEWEDQFRAITPTGEAMIVVAKTRFKSHVFDDSQLLALLEYKAGGELYFGEPDSGEPRKATLEVSGACKWNTGLGLPHSLQQKMEFRVMDYNLIRASGDLLGDETLATISLMSTDTTLKLKGKTLEKQKAPAPAPPSP